MSPGFGVALMMNNYFHDVATALLFASGAALAVMLRAFERSGGPGARTYFLAIYRGMSRLAVLSIGWIVVGGIPRTIFYTRFEWANAAGRSQVPALAVKHVLMFALVACGIVLWRNLRRQVAAIEAELERERAHASQLASR